MGDKVRITYLEADFEVFFTPQGRHVAPMAVKFGMEGDRESPPACQISPHRCNGKGVGPPKLKFLLKLDQNVEYKRPEGAYPMRVFQKNGRVYTPYQDALAVKI